MPVSADWHQNRMRITKQVAATEPAGHLPAAQPGVSLWCSRIQQAFRLPAIQLLKSYYAPLAKGNHRAAMPAHYVHQHSSGTAAAERPVGHTVNRCLPNTALTTHIPAAASCVPHTPAPPSRLLPPQVRPLLLRPSGPHMHHQLMRPTPLFMLDISHKASSLLQGLVSIPGPAHHAWPVVRPR